MRVPDLIAAIDAGSARIVEVLTGEDPDMPVPTCPDWCVRDLVRHLGGIHRWAATYVDEARTAVIETDLEELAGGWPPDTDLLDWFASGASHLTASLRAAPADLECFTFLSAPSPLMMWARRQAHETSIHRADAEAAVGVVTGFDVGFAADGIDELTTAFITRAGRGPRSDPPRTLPNDHASRWLIHMGADAAVTERVAAPSDATVVGSASDLYLWAWNRIDVDAIQIRGDDAVAHRWRETVHVRWN